MANTEQLNLLKAGVDGWNKWRERYPSEKIDLRGVDLDGAELRGAQLAEADLSGAGLIGADLSGANLEETDFRGTILRGADLQGAILFGALFIQSDLGKANLREANLQDAVFSATNLPGTNLRNAILANTTLRAIDLSEPSGLENIHHYSSSGLSIDTMVFSKGKIPEIFLRGCGLSDWEIEAAKLYDPNLSNQEMDEILYKVHDIRANQPVQISPLFISYSHADGKFVDKLEKHLNGIGARFWRDVHDATSGKLEKQIDRAIRHNPTVLLVLSENSIKSDWVEHEVRLARELEKETQRDVLCPVGLDLSWKSSLWPKRLMEQITEYNILDFSKWNDNNYFKDTFVKLIDGLNLYYKKQS